MKRIINHLKENWIKYGFETLVITAGILLAFGLNTWNENRKERLQEVSYLIGFKTDLILCRTELDRVIKLSHRVDSANQQIISLMYDEDGKDFELIVAANNGMPYTMFKDNHGTIDDIMGSGNLNVITDKRIRRAISSWESDLKDIREWEINAKTNNVKKGSLYRQYIDGVDLEFKIQTQIETQGKFDPTGTFLSESHKADLFENITYRNMVRSASNNARVLNGKYLERAQSIDSLIMVLNHKNIEAEIARLEGQ